MRCFSHLLSILPKNYFKKYKKRNIVNIQEDAKTLIVISLLLKVVHLRQRLDNAVSSSRDRAFALDTTLAMIQTLIDCDEFQDIATLRVRFTINYHLLPYVPLFPLSICSTV